MIIDAPAPSSDSGDGSSARVWAGATDIQPVSWRKKQ